MGSKLSKAKVSAAKPPTPTTPTPVHVLPSTPVPVIPPIPVLVKAKSIVTGPRIPQDIINEIADHLAVDSDFRSIQACALVCKSSVQACRRHLFRTIAFAPRDVDRWFKAFPVPEESPAHYVRDLRVWIAGDGCFPEKFFKHTSWFTNVEKMSLFGHAWVPLLRRTSLWRLPQSITSLTIDTGVVTLVQVRDIIAQLPSLDDLLLSGSLVGVDRRELLGIGTVLKGRFCGKLNLSGGYAGEDVIDMLLEIPSGLRFTEMRISCTCRVIPSAVRVAEACGETLVKLSHLVTFRDHCVASERSFDFSKFPNLQEVYFGFPVNSMVGGLLWIPTALSTLRRATSPRLSSLRLDCVGSSTDQSIRTLIEDMGNDLRRIANEFTRIDREFKGTVNLTVVRDPGFEMVLDALNILQQHEPRLRNSNWGTLR